MDKASYRVACPQLKRHLFTVEFHSLYHCIVTTVSVIDVAYTIELYSIVVRDVGPLSVFSLEIRQRFVCSSQQTLHSRSCRNFFFPPSSPNLDIFHDSLRTRFAHGGDNNNINMGKLALFNKTTNLSFFPLFFYRKKKRIIVARWKANTPCLYNYSQ